MLKRMEIVEGAPSAPAEQPRLPPRRLPVWVRSKSQAPYLFYPWMDPCAPHEWPYDLQALRGTEDYLDIIEWYLRRHPDVPRCDLMRYESELARCVGDALQISVEGYNDVDTGKKELTFTVWGFEPDVFGRESAEIEAFYDLWVSTPALMDLWQAVSVTTRNDRFENRQQQP